jgi:hypothetical protein
VPTDISPRDVPFDDDDWVPEPEPAYVVEHQELQPGTRAPVTGHYEELNVFGALTGRVERVCQGEHLPLGPRGFTWRQTEQEGCYVSSSL